MKMNKRKEMKFKRENRTFLRTIDKNINLLTKEIEVTTNMAAEAKQNGLKSQYQKALNHLVFNNNARAKYISLKFDIKMAMNLRNSLQIVHGFSEAMSSWGKSISKISKDINIDSVIKKVDEATEIIEEKNDELDELTDVINSGFDSLTSQTSRNSDSINNDEAMRIVESYIANSGKGSNVNQIGLSDSELNELKKMLGEGE